MKRISELLFMMFIAGIISGCESWPETLPFETSVSDLSSTFKFTKAERFSYKYAVGDYYAYTDTIVIYFIWECISSNTNGCAIGGSNFSLLDHNNNSPSDIGKSGAFTYELPPSVSIDSEAQGCCGDIDVGDKILVYVAYNVDHSCLHKWIIKYDRFISDSGPKYFIDLPDSVQCSEQ